MHHDPLGRFHGVEDLQDVRVGVTVVDDEGEVVLPGQCDVEPEAVGLHLLGLRIAGAVIVQAGFTDRHHPGQRGQGGQLRELGVEGRQSVALEEPGGVVGVDGDGGPDPGVGCRQLRRGARGRQVASDVDHSCHPDHARGCERIRDTETGVLGGGSQMGVVVDDMRRKHVRRSGQMLRKGHCSFFLAASAAS